MAPRLADTNVVSYLVKGPSLGILYLPHFRGHTPVLSFMTVAELYEGAYRARWGLRRVARLETILRGYLVIPSTPDICRRWGEVHHEGRRQPIGVADAWIAATALVHDCELVTHNPRDFRGIADLRLITEA